MLLQLCCVPETHSYNLFCAQVVTDNLFSYRNGLQGRRSVMPSLLTSGVIVTMHVMTCWHEIPVGCVLIQCHTTDAIGVAQSLHVMLHAFASLVGASTWCACY